MMLQSVYLMLFVGVEDPDLFVPVILVTMMILLMAMVDNVLQRKSQELYVPY
ncbi:hypothetical protein AM593_04182, partial [Mytilus galloprovincialis]